MTQLVLSLFPGIDMLGRAFEEEGFVVVRGPDVIFGGDIRTFHPPAGRFDGIIGGPPCQTFSTLANLVRAKGYEPRFGNLIPEYERCAMEARPAWFLMEEVRGAPIPAVEGYAVHAFTLDHCALDGGDGLGLEQERLRRFSYGVRGGGVADLRRWIRLAALLLPARSGTATQAMVNNSDESKGRVRAPAVLGNHRETPVALGGSGKPKPGATHRMPPVVRYRLPEACRLQGLPEDFLADAPFTAEGKLKAVANGVPIALGRALARAIRQQQGLPLREEQPA